jgi:hypothetical protein
MIHIKVEPEYCGPDLALISKLANKNKCIIYSIDIDEEDNVIVNVTSLEIDINNNIFSHNVENSYKFFIELCKYNFDIRNVDTVLLNKLKEERYNIAGLAEYWNYRVLNETDLSDEEIKEFDSNYFMYKKAINLVFKLAKRKSNE